MLCQRYIMIRLTSVLNASRDRETTIWVTPPVNAGPWYPEGLQSSVAQQPEAYWFSSLGAQIIVPMVHPDVPGASAGRKASKVLQIPDIFAGVTTPNKVCSAPMATFKLDTIIWLYEASGPDSKCRPGGTPRGTTRLGCVLLSSE